MKRDQKLILIALLGAFLTAYLLNNDLSLRKMKKNVYSVNIPTKKGVL